MTTPVQPAELYYDPEVRAVLEAAGTLGPVTPDTLDQVRANRILLTQQVPLSGRVEIADHTVPGPDGASDIRLRIHRRQGLVGPQPALFWMHGGGYVLGSPEQDDLRFDRWCQRFDLVGVSVQYRLAPEHPYPAGLDDCYAGLRWVIEQGSTVGIDPSRVGIGGPSAGGGMAAALGLLVRDRAELSIDYQMLIYPMIDDTRTTATAQADVPIWDPASNRFGWASYLGDRFESDDIPYTAAPARAGNLTGLPPTYVMVGTLDGFCDEDIAYATRLNHAGVEVELHVYPGAPHGFDGFAPTSRVARQARHDINQWLGRQLGQPGD